MPIEPSDSPPNLEADGQETEPKQPNEYTVDDIREHESIKKVLKKLDSPKLKFDVSLIDELRNMTVAKSIRDGELKRRFPRHVQTEADLIELGNLIEETQANRDRVLEIKVSLILLKTELEKLWDAVDVFAQQFSIVAKIRNGETHTATIGAIVEPLYERLQNIGNALKVADMVDSNLNNTHFALKEISDIGKLIVSRKPMAVSRSY